MKYASQNKRGIFGGTKKQKNKILSLQKSAKASGLNLENEYKRNSFKYLNTESSVNRVINKLEKQLNERLELEKQARAIQRKKTKILNEHLDKKDIGVLQNERNTKRAMNISVDEDIFDNLKVNFKKLSNEEIKKYTEINSKENIEKTVTSNIIELKLKGGEFIDRYFKGISDTQEGRDKIKLIKSYFQNGEIEIFDKMYNELTSEEFLQIWSSDQIQSDDYEELTEMHHDRSDRILKFLSSLKSKRD